MTTLIRQVTDDDDEPEVDTATPRTERECPRCGKRTQPDDVHTCSPQATPRTDDARESGI